jgi:hypothetical protein
MAKDFTAARPHPVSRKVIQEVVKLHERMVSWLQLFIVVLVEPGK